MKSEHAQSGQNGSQEETSRWDAAFEEVLRARETNTSPNVEVFRDLTKSAGGN